ncbi:MAG: peptidylprolyl isomerase [Phycisphaerales bacterium]
MDTPPRRFLDAPRQPAGTFPALARALASFVPARLPSSSAVALLAVTWSGLAAGGCGTTNAPPVGRAESWIEPIMPDTVVDARPAAFINGRSVPWGRLRDELTEAAGGEILRDLVLEQQLERALSESAVQLRPADIEREQTVLLETLDADPDVAARLLAELRDRRRLGETRFRGLLRRNAALRALVSDQVRVTEADRQVMRDTLYGPRRRVRLMTLPRVVDAERAYVQVTSPGGPTFAELTSRVSTDVSASRGGLLEPMARLDPTWPAGLREAAFALSADGAISAPVLLEGTIALLQLVEVIPGRPDASSADAGRIDRLARLSRERVLMDRLARELVVGSAVSIVDPALRSAWERERSRVRREG